MKKPFKGRIYHWKKLYIDPQWAKDENIKHLGFAIEGYTTKDTHLDTSIRTSLVVKSEPRKGAVTIETLNSRYLCVGPENV